MKNTLLQDAIFLYRMRNVKGFEAVANRPEVAMQPRTVQKQIANMAKQIMVPISEPKKTNRLDPNDSTLKAASRAFRRRINSKRHLQNGAFLQDKRATVAIPNRDAYREYNFMRHATKGYRLRSVFRTSAEVVSRDSGYSALILPDVTDVETMGKIRESHASPPRLAVTKDGYLNRNGNTPGSIRRAGITS